MNLTFAVCANVHQEPERQIADLADQGVTALEGSHQPLLENEPATLRRWRRLLEKAGMRYWSIHAPFGPDYNLAAPEPEKRQKALESIALTLERAAELGAAVVIVHAGVKVEKEEERATVEERALEGLATLVKVAERAGVRLGLENLLPQYPCERPEQLRRMVEALNSPWLGVCFDTGHAHVGGNVLEFFQALAPWVITFHLQDNDRSRDLHLPPGYGTIPWEEFGSLLRSTGFTDPLVIEAPPWQRSNWSTLLRETQALLTRGRWRLYDEQGETFARCTRCGHWRFHDEEGWFCACPNDGGR